MSELLRSTSAMRRARHHRLAAVGAAVGSLAPSTAIADGTVTYELREEVTGIALPKHDYDVTGTCATGTGTAPASAYANGGSGSGMGFGVGAGARVGYLHFVSAPTIQERTWWGLRAGAGLDLDLLYAKVPTGLTDVSGELCARVKADGAGVDYRSSSVLLAQVPMFFGAQVGIGKPKDGATWSGVVLGAAWAPTVSLIKPWVDSADLSASYLATELTVDFATIRYQAPEEAAKRIAFFFSSRRAARARSSSR